MVSFDIERMVSAQLTPGNLFVKSAETRRLNFHPSQNRVTLARVGRALPSPTRTYTLALGPK
jgi:hypothetical protein